MWSLSPITGNGTTARPGPEGPSRRPTALGFASAPVYADARVCTVPAPATRDELAAPHRRACRPGPGGPDRGRGP